MGMERTTPGTSAGLITLRLPDSTSIPLHKGHAGAGPFYFSDGMREHSENRGLRPVFHTLF